MAVKKKSDLELERDYFANKKRATKKPAVKKTAARKKNPTGDRYAVTAVDFRGKVQTLEKFPSRTLANEYASYVEAKNTGDRIIVVDLGAKKSAPRRKNPDLATHAVKDKVHRAAILRVNHAVKALAGKFNPINTQALLSRAQGYIEGAKDAGAITLSEANELFTTLRSHMKV